MSFRPINAQLTAIRFLNGRTGAITPRQSRNGKPIKGRREDKKARATNNINTQLEFHSLMRRHHLKKIGYTNNYFNRGFRVTVDKWLTSSGNVILYEKFTNFNDEKLQRASASHALKDVTTKIADFSETKKIDAGIANNSKGKKGQSKLERRRKANAKSRRKATDSTNLLINLKKSAILVLRDKQKSKPQCAKRSFSK